MSSSEEYLDKLLKGMDEPNKPLSTDEIEALFAASENNTDKVVIKDMESDTNSEKNTVVPAIDDDPNRAMSADEIAALFAASEAANEVASEVKEEPVVEAVEKDEAGKLEIEEAREMVVPAIDDDPNRAMSADEIAALFAASEAANEAASEVKEEPVVEAVEKDEAGKLEIEEAREMVVPAIDDDPNRAMSADEIAALFAASEAANEAASEIKEEPVVEAVEKDEAGKLEIEEAREMVVPAIDDDPNRAMSADEIAALFVASEAANEAASEIKEEPVVEAVEKDEAGKLEIEEAREMVVPAIDDDPNRAMSADEIAALFAASEAANETTEDVTSTEEIEQIQENIDSAKKEELDINNPDDLDLILGIKEKDVKDKDVTEIIDEMETVDDDLSEISELLKKSDANELVIDDNKDEISNKIDDAEVSLDEENLEEESESKESKKKRKREKREKKEKKPFSLFKRKKKNEETENISETLESLEAVADSNDNGNAEKFTESKSDIESFLSDGVSGDVNEEAADISLLNLEGEETLNLMDGFSQEMEFNADSDIQEELEALPEKSKEAAKKEKKGFFGKIFATLIEEVSEDEDVAETPVISEEEEGLENIPEKKGKKEKKKKDKKAKKAEDADDNAAILEEVDSEEENKKKKKKPKKPKKEKKVVEPTEEDKKKLPKKMVIRIFVLCFSIMALLLVCANIIPSLLSLRTARKAFYEKDYLTTYQEMTGKELSESDSIILNKATIVLRVQRKYSAYKNFHAVGMELEALNALLDGQVVYDKLLPEAQETGMAGEIEEIYKKIVDALFDTYGVTEEKAREINALETDLAYTKAVRAIVNGESAETTDEVDSAGDSVEKETQNEADIAPGEVKPEYEDVLPEEMEY